MRFARSSNAAAALASAVVALVCVVAPLAALSLVAGPSLQSLLVAGGATAIACVGVLAAASVWRGATTAPEN